MSYVDLSSSMDQAANMHKADVKIQVYHVKQWALFLEEKKQKYLFWKSG